MARKITPFKLREMYYLDNESSLINKYSLIIATAHDQLGLHADRMVRMRMRGDDPVDANVDGAEVKRR